MCEFVTVTMDYTVTMTTSHPLLSDVLPHLETWSPEQLQEEVRVSCGGSVELELLPTGLVKVRKYPKLDLARHKETRTDNQS